MNRFQNLAIARMGMFRAAAYAAGYALWVSAFKLVALTVITYFTMSTSARFQDISEAYGSNELILSGVASLCFVLLLRFLNPLTSTTTEELFTPYRFERKFVPGFLHGAVLALGVTVAFLLSGLFKYLGGYIQAEEAPIALATVLLHCLALISLAYCEEFIFRHKILSALRRQLPDPYAAGLTAILYCGIKVLQFDLGWMQVATLFLLAYRLAVRAMVDGDFARGGGFWAGLLVVLHPLLSLPVFGNELQGILLVKYEAGAEADVATSRFLTGGAGGPLSSFALQLLFMFDIIQTLVKNKKILLHPRPQRIK